MAGHTLKQALEAFLTPKERSLLVRGFDVVGDIGIIIIPEPLQDREELIGEAVLASNKRLRLVAKRVGQYGGEYRTIGLQRIAGVGELQTVHREYGIRLYVNPAEVYFSPRSNSERYRIAQQVQADEEILVLFSGIAPLPLMIAKYSSVQEIVAIEKNPQAHVLAQKNIAVNKISCPIRLFCGDAQELLPTLSQTFDRIALVLPSAASSFLPAALRLLRHGGSVHCYDFSSESGYGDSLARMEIAVRAGGREIEDIQIHACGHVAPTTYRVCCDMKIL